MSGTSGAAAGTPVGTPISSLPQATTASGTDFLLVLQLDTTVTPSVLRPRLMPVSVLASAVNLTPAALLAAINVALASAPTALPETSDVTWNNDGVLQLS